MTKQFISKIRETFLSKILEVKQFSWIQFSYYSFIHKIKHIYTALLHLKAQRYTDKEQEVWTLNRQATWVPSFLCLSPFLLMIWAALLASSRRKPVISEKMQDSGSCVSFLYKEPHSSLYHWNWTFVTERAVSKHL